MRKGLNKNQKGSTIIEVLTVAFIIAGMASLILPNIFMAVERSKLTGCVSNVRNIASSLEQYHNEHEAYPESLASLCPNYLSTIPFCPNANNDTYTKGYEIHADRSSFTVSCKGHHHERLGLPADQPYFSHEAGGLKYQYDLEISGHK